MAGIRCRSTKERRSSSYSQSERQDLPTWQNRSHLRWHWMFRLISRNRRLVLKSEADVIEAIEQAMPRKIVHRKSRGETLPIVNAQFFQINRQPAIRGVASAPHDLSHQIFGKGHR